MEENKQSEIKPLMNSLDNNSSPFLFRKNSRNLGSDGCTRLGHGIFVAKMEVQFPG